MFDVSGGELMLVLVIGLVVLGPKRLPVAVKTVAGWIKTMRSLSTKVQSELAKEFQLQELQESISKFQKLDFNSMSPELKSSMEELKAAAEAMRKNYIDSGAHVASVNHSLDDSIRSINDSIKMTTRQIEAVSQQHVQDTPQQSISTYQPASLEDSNHAEQAPAITAINSTNSPINDDNIEKISHNESASPPMAFAQSDQMSTDDITLKKS